MMKKPHLQLLSSSILAAAIFGVMAFSDLPYVRSSPGDTYNAIGTEFDVEVVDIESTSQYPLYEPKGELRLLTVSQWGGPYGRLPWLDAIRSVWDRTIVNVPTEFEFPEAISTEEVEIEGSMQLESAASQAIGAALQHLNIPVTSTLHISYVRTDGPANKILKPDDVLVSIGDQPTPSMQQLDDYLGAAKPGATEKITVLRKGKLKTVKVTTVDNGEGRPLIGIGIVTDYAGPMDIQVNLENVGGPSAGLAFALAIVDKLTPGNLIGDRVVALTGTISADGSVGPIGGLNQKFAAAARSGATIMMIPIQNCESFTTEIPAELDVYAVSSLSQAIDVLEGKASPRCP
ncbi:MAG: hypothetical protein RIS75_134 [Actinomycetota bacterium]|jgi:PDZ domain-containing protein